MISRWGFSWRSSAVLYAISLATTSAALILAAPAHAQPVPPVCDRTPQVRDGILELIPGVSDCADVTDSHLSGIMEKLSLGKDNIDGSIATLKAGDFSGLVNLPKLGFWDNELSALPATVFSGLANLMNLGLRDNQLSTLPADVFSGLGNLRKLVLGGNQLTALPTTIFSGLTNLQELDLGTNQLTTLPPGVFSGLDNLGGLFLAENRLTTLPPGTFSGLSSLRALQLENSPGAPFSLKLRLEPADETKELADLLSANTPAMAKFTLREGAPYPLTFALTASGVQLSTDQVTIPTGNTQSVAFTMTRNAGENQVRITLSEPSSPPTDCNDDWRSGTGDCYTGFEIVHDRTGPRAATIRFTSTPQNPDGYVEGERIRVDVVFDRGLVIDPPITVGSSSSPTLALQIGADRRTATCVAESNVLAGILSFVYRVGAGDFDRNGVSVAQNGLQLNGSTITDVFNNPATVELEGGLLADFPEQKVGRDLPLISFTDGDNRIWGDEGGTAEAAFSLNPAPAMPTTVYYAFDHDTADADDYEAGSGEVVVPADATAGTIEIPIMDDDDIEPVRERFYVNLVDSADYVLGSRTRLEVFIAEGVCDRTPQVRDRIRGSSSCRDISTGTINGIGRLVLSARGIEELKEKDFLQLTMLEDLYLRDNELTSLPEGVFAGLGDLEILTLHGNELTTLPEGVFAGLGDLEILTLNGNELTTLPEGTFAELGSLGLLTLYRNRLTTLPPGAFLGLSSLRSLRLHDNPGSTFRLTLGLEPVDEAANVNLKRLTSLLSTSEPATVKLTLREGAPYPLTLALAASGVELSTDQVMIPAGSTRSVAFTMTRNMDRARIDFSEPPSPPDDCPTGGDWNHEGPCFSGFEIVGAPTIYFVYDGMAPQVATIRFTSTPQDPEGYIEGEVIKVDVVFDRGLVTSPITEGSSSSPTLALQIGNNRRTATYVVGSNAAAGVLSFVYTVGAGDLDENGVSVAQDGLGLNGATVTEPVGDRPANVALEAGLLADFPEQKVRRLPLISFEDNQIEPAEGETVNAVFNFNDALMRPTTIHYTVDPDSADASDYMAGSGKIALPADATSGTIQIFIVDDDIIEPARETFSLNLVDSDGYALGSPTRIEVRIREGVCDRTGPVRIAIENAIGANHCSDVSSVPKSPRISLTRWDTVTAYKRDDFTDENLNKLPFRSVEISGHSRLTTLPAGLFGNLLEHLLLQDNALATLPENLFAGLVNLQRLRLDDNDLTTLPKNLFAGLVNLQWLRLDDNDLTALPEGTFTGLSSLRSLQLHDNPGAPFRLELGLEPADETTNVNLKRLASLLSPLEPATVKLTLRKGAPYPLALTLTPSGVRLSADQVMIPAGSTQSVAFTATRIAGENRVRIALSEPPPPNDCPNNWKHQGQCFTGIEIVGGPTINFVYDGMAPQVTTIRLTSTPQAPNGYRQGETIKVDVVFDRGLVISPIMEGPSSSPTLTLQIGADRGTATYVVGSNVAAGVLSFVYTVTAEDFDEDGVSVVQDGLELNGVTLTEPVGDLDANVALENRFLADFPGHKVSANLPSVSFEESEIESDERGTINAVFNLDVAVAKPTTVLYALTPGTANTDDYVDVAGSGEVVVPASETRGIIRISIVDDELIEHARDTFSLNLVDSNNYALGSPTRIEISIREGVCDRTPQVAEAIRDARGQSHCSDVSDPSVITRLSIVDNPSLTTLKGRDFFELDGLQRLDLNNNGLTTLPAGVFDDLGRLTELRLNDNELTTLTAGTFAGLPALRTLLLQNNRVSTLSASIFNGLSNLQTIDLGSNGIMQLPDNIFADNGNLRNLLLGGNSLTTLPAGVFAGLGRLTELRLNNNDLTTLTESVFDALGSLTELWLDGNDLTALPAGTFAGLQMLRTLRFQNNQVVTWPASIFNGLSNLQTIDFGSNGITQLPDDIFADNGNLRNLLLGGNQLRELPEQVFFGLPQLRNLAVNGNRLTELPAGAFSGYAFLGDLRLYDNRLESLPPGLFLDLERAGRLGFHNNRLTALPPGAFSGISSNLGALTLGGNPGEPFQLKLRLESADEEQAPTLTDDPVVLRATLREGAPYALEIDLQAAHGTLSTTEVTIEAGSTWSGTFTVTRVQGENSVAVSFTSVSPPTPPNRCPGWQRYRGQCFAGFEIVSDAEFALDDQPLSAVSGVAITSTPISGNSYTADNPNDEIVVEIGFSEEIDVVQANDGSWPSLALGVGDVTRFAVYDDAESSTDRLVFRYKPQAADVDDNGISVPDGALRLNGALILDAGVPVSLSSLSLGTHAIRNAPGHNVNVQVGRDLQLSFDPAEVTLRADGPPEVVALTLGGNELLETDETVVVTLTPSPGLEVRSESGESLTMVTLGHGADATTRVRVSANRNATDPERLDATASALPDNVRVAEATLRVMVEQREIRVLFNPGRITLVRGGAAAEMVSRAVMMRTEPELQGDEALVVSLSADGVTLVSPTGPVRLTPENNAVTVTLAATRPLSALGAVSATLDENASLLGNARVTTEALAVEVVRGVNLSLSDLAGQDSVRFAADATTEVRVTTGPVLEGDERVTVTLSVDSRLRLESAGSALLDGNKLVLNAMNPDATVAVATDRQGLRLIRGISASGAGENVGVVGAAALRVITDAVDEVTVVLSPSPVVEVQQGGNAMLRMTTVPRLAPGQQAVVSLTIEPDDAGLSFFTAIRGPIREASSATVTVYLHQAGSGVDVGVAAAPDAVIGNTAQVTLTVLENTLVEVNVDGRSRVTLEATTPQVAIRFDPAPLALDLGTSETVELSLTDFTLAGNQTAEFEVSVEGEGLSLQGNVQMIRVSFAAGEITKSISVMASDDAAPVGRLVVRPVGDVELAGDMETASLPIEALQEVNVHFEPNLVLIPWNRSTKFKVMIDPPLVGDRKTTVTLEISAQGFTQGFAQGFAFGAGRTQRETITFDAGKSSETVTVATTAAPSLTAAVSVEVTASSGVRTMGLPILRLQAMVPRAALDLTPDGGAPGDTLVLNTGTGKAVRLSLPDLTLLGDHVAVFEVSVSGGGLSLQGGTPTLPVRLDANNMTAEVTVSASDSAVSTGELRVRALSGVELSGGAQAATLPIRVLQRVSLRFNPTEVRIRPDRTARFNVEISPPLAADRWTVVTLEISGQDFTFGDGGTQHEIRFDARKSRETVRVATTATPNSMASVSVVATRTPSGVDLATTPTLRLTVTEEALGTTLRIRVFLEGALE